MEFVRGDYAESGIAKFPPKLVPDCRNFHGFSWLGRVLDRVNDSCRREKEHNNDQDRNDGPCDFNLCASIHLRRLMLCVRRSAAELHDDVSQQTEDYDKNHPGDAEDEEREMTDRIRRRGARIAEEDPNCLPTRTMQCSLQAIVSEREPTNSFDRASYGGRKQSDESFRAL